MRKTCPACSAKLPSNTIWRMNTGNQFSCSQCNAVLGWQAGGPVALVLLIAFASVPAFIWLAGRMGPASLVVAILLLIAGCGLIAIQGMRPVLLHRT